MSRTHGFRVFTAEAFVNRRKDQPALNAEKTSRVRDEILSLLEAVHAQGTHFIAAPIPVEGEPAKPQKSLTVDEPVLVRDDLIHVTVAMGETGSHDRATKPQSPPMPLVDWSPEARHRVTFLFPTTPGTEFLIVSEAIRNRDPLQRLLKRLTTEGLAQKKAAQEAEKKDRAEARQQKRKLPGLLVHERLLFDARQAADNQYLNELINSAETASATFTSTKGSNRGSRSDKVQRTLRIVLDDHPDVARTTGRAWFGRSSKGQGVTHAEGVSELSTLLHKENLMEEGEEQQYESASISLRDKNRDSTTIGVDTLRDAFTYPVSDGAPSDWFYYERVGRRVESVARQSRLDIASIDPDEVNECLNDLT